MSQANETPKAGVKAGDQVLYWPDAAAFWDAAGPQGHAFHFHAARDHVARGRRGEAPAVTRAGERVDMGQHKKFVRSREGHLKTLLGAHVEVGGPTRGWPAVVTAVREGGLVDLDAKDPNGAATHHLVGVPRGEPGGNHIWTAPEKGGS